MREKTKKFGFRPGPTQTGLYSHRRWLEAGNFLFQKKRSCTIHVAKTKMDRGWNFWIMVLSVYRKQRHLSALRLLRSCSAPLFSPLQSVGFPMRRNSFHLAKFPPSDRRKYPRLPVNLHEVGNLYSCLYWRMLHFDIMFG